MNKAVPLGTAPGAQTEPGFWDKVFHHKKTSSSVTAHDDDDTDDWVSISVPADAALKHLGVQGDDQDLEDKKNYFKRMAARVQEKFDDDSDDSDDDSDNDNKATPKTEEEKREKQQRKKLAPKVDPKEMKAAHKAIYQTADSDDDEADKKMFGSWWGCHPRRSWAERKLAKEREAEAEKQRVLAELAAQKKAEEEAAAAAAAAEAARNKWWKFGLSKSPEEKAAKEKERVRAKERKERKTTTHKRQAIASAGKRVCHTMGGLVNGMKGRENEKTHHCLYFALRYNSCLRGREGVPGA